MNQQQEQRTLKQDNILLLQAGALAIHSLAWPFRVGWVRLGRMGRRAFGKSAFVGCSFLFPLWGQWPHGPADNRLFLRSWQILWWITFAQWVTAHLLNKRYGTHSREIGNRVWVGRAGGILWPALLVGLPGYFLVEPVCHGLGMYLTYAPAFYWLSDRIVEWKQGREAEEVTDARIAGRDIQGRI